MTNAPAGSAVASRLAAVRERIQRACLRSRRDPAEVTLIAVSKGHPIEAIIAAAEAGQVDFGENRVQEAVAKLRALEGAPDPLRFHLIGHLQTNKVRDAVGPFAILHAVDSTRLLTAIAARATSPVRCLAEVNVAADPAKYGLAPEDLPAFLESAAGFPEISLEGLMTVAPLTPDPEAARPHFRALRRLAERHGLPLRSMGMTEDFEIAIEEGATHVRVGRAIFGERSQ